MKEMVGDQDAMARAQTEAPPGMVWIPGGTFVMGSNHHYPEEAPAHEATVEGFWMDIYSVTNTQFRIFVEATQYLTLAERAPNPQDYPQADPALLVPGSAVFRQPPHRVDLRNPGNWWEYVPGANWQHPEGLASSLEGRWNHPVTHVAYEDALAYATWAGKQLPTESQWERAARGGLEAAVYAWGNEFTPGGKRVANTWQGEFPWQNLRADAQVGSLPVGSFLPNGYGLYDMIGNVWEWTTDWYQEHHAARGSCCHPVDAARAWMEQSLDPVSAQPRKVLKGGSFLCAPNYCRRYRPAARIPETLDTSTCHLGFRCVITPEGK